MTNYYTNIAADNSQHVTQMGHLGDLRQNTGRGSAERLQEGIADLQQALMAAWERDEIDRAAYERARQELTAATRHIPAAVRGDRRKLLDSLNRVRPYLSGVVDLVAKAAAIMTAARGL